MYIVGVAAYCTAGCSNAYTGCSWTACRAALTGCSYRGARIASVICGTVGPRVPPIKDQPPQTSPVMSGRNPLSNPRLETRRERRPMAWIPAPRLAERPREERRAVAFTANATVRRAFTAVASFRLSLLGKSSAVSERLSERFDNKSSGMWALLNTEDLACQSEVTKERA